MRSCQDYLSELRGKIHQVENSLRSEMKNLYKVQELLSEEREKREAELKQEELKIQKNEIELKRKELELEQLKVNCDEVRKRSSELDGENEKLRRNLQKVKTQLQDKTNNFLLEQGNLEKELSKVQELLKDTKLSNRWTKIFQDKHLKNEESEEESSLQQKLKLLSDEFNKKMDDYDENLKEIDMISFLPKREKLRSLQETLAQLVAECTDMEKKNNYLQREINALKKFP